MERIVVGVDGSEGAHRALRWAVEEARLRNAHVEAVIAWHAPYVEGYPYFSARIDPDELEAAARATVDHAVGALEGSLPRVDVAVRCGSPASVLLDQARDAALVVVGSRGRGGFAGLLLGSVSQQVCQHAPVPVVVVP